VDGGLDEFNQYIIELTQRWLKAGPMIRFGAAPQPAKSKIFSFSQLLTSFHSLSVPLRKIAALQ
jgi:hypothetical protein